MACYEVKDSTIHAGSCQGGDSCLGVQNSIIGEGSCTKDKSCHEVVNVKIGNNSCNGEKVCCLCRHNVPDNACNQGSTDDLTEDGYCKFCGEKINNNGDNWCW